MLCGIIIINDTLSKDVLEEIDSSYEYFDVESEKTELWIGLKYYKNIENAMNGVDTEVWVKKNEWAGGTKKNVTKKAWNDYFFYLSKNDGAGNYPSSLADLFNQNNETDRTLGEKFQNDMNANNTKEDLQSTIKRCKPLRKLVYQNTTEWKIDEDYVDALCGSFEKNKERIKAQQESLAFTAKGVNDTSTTNWYFHPIRFIDYVNKVIPFNPYIKGITYNDSYYTVTSNPGFAPVYTWGEKYSANGKDYASITGLFNENYATESRYTGYIAYYHEGLDLRGATGTPIHSLIRAEVLAYGWYGGFGRTIFLRNLDGVGVYLLGHLSEYANNIKVGMKFIPGQVVAKVGQSGSNKNEYAYPNSHLHITYYNYGEDASTIFIMDNDEIIVKEQTLHKELLDERRDPFNHNNGVEKFTNISK